MRSSVTEIHEYPVCPEGFVEPLFHTAGSRKEIAEHLASSGWLCKASQLTRGAGGAAHRREEVVRVERRPENGALVLVRGCGRRRRGGCGSGERRVVVRRVIRRWREVSGWWEEGGGVDRHLYRISLSDGSVVDLARHGDSGWMLVGVLD